MFSQQSKYLNACTISENYRKKKKKINCIKEKHNFYNPTTTKAHLNYKTQIKLKVFNIAKKKIRLKENVTLFKN